MTTAFTKKRITALAAGALAVAGLLAGCSSTPAPAPSGSDGAPSFGDISVQLSWIKNSEFAGEYYALDNGYYADGGFGDVDLVSGPDTGVAKLDSGAVQFALSDAASIGAADADGDTLKIVGTTYQKNPFTIVSLASSGIKTPQDLIGKKIGVDASNESLWQGFLKANGIDPSQVTEVPGQFNGPSLVESGAVDGYVAYITNEAIAIQNDTGSVSRLDFADNNFPYVAETITTTQDMIDNHPDEVKAFILAEIKGWTDTFKNSSDDVVAKVIDHFNAAIALPGSNEASNSAGSLDPKETAQEFEGQKDLITSDETKTNGLFTISKTLQDATVKSLGAAGYTVTADQLFDTSFVDAIYKDNPDLINYGG